MKVRITPSRGAGTLAAPPSKSDSHRALICAALAAGTSVLHGLAPSEDVLATIDCLRALGAKIDFDGASARVTGLDPASIPDALLPCRESGSTLRFLLPVALLGGSRCTFVGAESLFRRPMGIYETLCAERSLLYRQEGASVTVQGRLTPGTYEVPGNVSSQFISGLLFALPLLDGESILRIAPPVESRPYVELTLAALRRFGVEARFTDGCTLAIPGRQRCRAGEYAIEGDWSNAAYLEALNLLGGDVTLTGLDPASLQGDQVYRRYFAALREGCPTLDLADCPDLGPVCMALAAALHGAEFLGTRRLRLKESDRPAAMAAELAKFGVRTALEDDRMTVLPGPLHPPAVPLDGHNDHRIVMSLALLCTLTGGEIAGAEAVRKSFPDFFAQIASLGIIFTQE